MINITLVEATESFTLSTQYKIVFVDINQIFSLHPQTKKAQELLMKEHEEWIIKREKLEKELDLLEEELENLPVTAKSQRKEKEMQIKKKREEINILVTEASTYLPRRKEELEGEILKLIQQALEKLATREKIDIILDKSVFLYGPEELDITKKVKELLKIK